MESGSGAVKPKVCEGQLMMDGDGWMWGHGWGWGGWLLMCMVVLLLWAALITSLVLAIRYLGASNRPPERELPSHRPAPRTPSPSVTRTADR